MSQLCPLGAASALELRGRKGMDAGMDAGPWEETDLNEIPPQLKACTHSSGSSELGWLVGDVLS